jgi:hypothetical protein
MNTDITGRAVALVAAVISAAGGLAILLDDVVKGAAHFEIKHGITIGIVALAILAGHSVVAAWRARHVFGVLGFLVVFLAATGLVVFKSTGRQAETTFQSQAEADLAAEARTASKAALARSEAMLADTQRDLARECKSGRGKRCQGIEATIGVYEAAITGHRATLDRLGAPKPVAPEAENFANLAAVFGADKAKVKAGAMLLVPFLTTALFEFGAIVGFAFAFRHRSATRAIKAAATKPEQPRQPSATETMQTSFHADDIEATRPTIFGGKNSGTDDTDNRGNPNNGGGNRPNGGGKGGGNRQAFEADVLTRLALGQTIECQDDLAAAHGVHKGVVSKWLKDMRRRDLIPAAQRVGRCHRLVAAE